MDAILSLLSPGNTSLAATLVLYSFVIAAGIYLGKLKVGGISLGVTFVLFVGILMGHFGYVVDSEVLKFIREFGLILFIFAIGLQVGPAFFSSFKKGGVTLNVLAVAIVVLNVAIAVTIYLLNRGFTTPAAIVGVLSGAVTNTPGLAAAQQAVGSPDAADTMAMGYAAAYPLGVIGIIAAILILRKAFRVNIADEIKKLDDEAAAEQQAPAKVSFQVTNERINGLTLKQLHDVIHCDFVISRLLNAYNEVIIPTSQTQIHVGDKVKVIMSAADELAFSAVLGPQIEMEWDDTPGQVVSRRIVLTQPKYNGVTLGQLHLHSAYQLNATRVNRGGVDPARLRRPAPADGRPHHRRRRPQRHQPPCRQTRQLHAPPQRA